MANTVSLRVTEAMPEDVGQGYVRMDNEDMDDIGVSLGDVVEIAGRKTTVAKVVPCFAQFKKQNLILMESIIRENAGVGIDERVTIKKLSWQPAKTIVLSPLDVTIDFSGADEMKHLERILNGKAMVIGDRVRVNLAAARGQYFTVIGTTPKGPVLINTSTQIKVTQTDASENRSLQASYEDVGGLDKELKKVREMIELPLKYPDLFRQLGVEAPKGVLLYGPPGTGKTLIARAVATETAAAFILVNGPEIINKFYGESEAKLREIFETAQRRAPAIIFIDEIDAIAPKRADVIGDVEKRIVAQLLALMDGLNNRGQVIVIGATNIPDMVDTALRRPGRFDRELCINPPDRSGRLNILKIHTRYMSIDDKVDLEKLAQMTHGFVGADLAVLCKEAGMNAVRRLLPQIDPSHFDDQNAEKLKVNMDDFLSAFRDIEPTATREFFSDKPNIKWENIGGLEEIKEKLRSVIEIPLQNPEIFKQMQIKLPKGILLTGPPGCGKTLLVHALAGSMGIHFISVDAATLTSRWLGEAEKGLRQIFKRAKQIAPCMIFFDEIDAMAPVRAGGNNNHETDRLVSQLLLEMSNLVNAKDVIVIAATNRPDMVDPALMRTGRFDFIIEIPLPTYEERLQIFKIHTTNMPQSEDIDFAHLAQCTEGLNGSDIETICKHAAMFAMGRCNTGKGYDVENFAVLNQDFLDGLKEVFPSKN